MGLFKMAHKKPRGFPRTYLVDCPPVFLDFPSLSLSCCPSVKEPLPLLHPLRVVTRSLQYAFLLALRVLSQHTSYLTYVKHILLLLSSSRLPISTKIHQEGRLLPSYLPQTNTPNLDIRSWAFFRVSLAVVALITQPIPTTLATIYR